MLWIVDGGMPSLPVEGRVEDWRKGETITVTHGENGEWAAKPVTYVAERTVIAENAALPDLVVEPMTLEGAIARCEQLASTCKDDAREEAFQQIHAWLWELALRRKEVKRLKAQNHLLNSMRGERRDRMRELGIGE